MKKKTVTIKGFILLEIILAMTLFVIIAPIAGKMLVSSISLLEKTVYSYQTKTIAERQAYLAMMDADILQEKHGSIIIGNDDFTWSREIQPWKAGKDLTLIKITVSGKSMRENYEIVFIKKN